MREANPQTIYLKDYTPPEYLIQTVDLIFELDAEDTLVLSRLTALRNPQCAAAGSTMTLLGEQLQLASVALDGEKLHQDQYLQTEDALTLFDVPQDRVFVVSIANRINPKANTALEGLYLSNGMLCTQCEAEGFRKITYFPDRPDIMSRFTTKLVADKDLYPVLLSNGNKTASGDLPDNRHWVAWDDPFNKPCYLFALVAGQLQCVQDNFTTQSGRTIDLQIYVEPHDLDKCAHAMQSLKNAMAWDEQNYGREYDLDLYMIVAVGHFNMGAMENKGLNIFNTKYVLARPDTATDADYEHIEGVIGHEYFHNWTGNRITCRDWFQLSLKEGLTVFRDQQFTADRTSKAVKRIEDVNMLRTRQFVEDSGPLAHPVRPDSYIEINNFYTLTVYEKGAEVVRMLHTLLGPETFRKATDLYFHRFDGMAVTCDDFVQAMEDAGNIDLSLFRRWYSQAGTPQLTASSVYDAHRQTLALTLAQHCQPTPGQQQKLPLHIPVAAGLLAADGSPLPIRMSGEYAGEQVILHLTEPQQTFIFEQLAEKPVLSLLRGFSAPVKLLMQRSPEELAFLLRYDSDTFNRWEAGQQLALQIILQRVEDIQQQRELQADTAISDTFAHLLEQQWQDNSYLALLLILPSETYIAEQMPVVDVEAIHQAREFVKHCLAARLEPHFTRLYQQNHREESGQFDAGAIGRRRIKNTCLSYFSKLANDTAYQYIERQFDTALNMTDQIAALGAMVNSGHPSTSRCLGSFYRQWQQEALVIDKWFALQATSCMPDTFAKVKELLEHPAFDLQNPNRVRSLIGAFSQGNALHFHAATGQGYQFLADQVIALNALNPQVAARMTASLTQWRRFDQRRQTLMKTQLERIIGTKDISKDVYEVATKSLA